MEKVEVADELTKALDEGKTGGSPKNQVFFASYLDEWREKQKNIKHDTDDLFQKFLQGQGDRHDIGAGIIEIRFGDSAPLAVSSGSSSGAAKKSAMENEHLGARTL